MHNRMPIALHTDGNMIACDYGESPAVPRLDLPRSRERLRCATFRVAREAFGSATVGPTVGPRCSTRVLLMIRWLGTRERPLGLSVADTIIYSPHTRLVSATVHYRVRYRDSCPLL